MAGKRWGARLKEVVVSKDTVLVCERALAESFEAARSAAAPLPEAHCSSTQQVPDCPKAQGIIFLFRFTV